MMRLGYQIPNFTYPEPAGFHIFNSVVAQAKVTEAAGFNRMFLMAKGLLGEIGLAATAK